MALKSKKLLDAVTTAVASSKEIFDSAKNLDFAVILDAALTGGETVDVELQFEAAGDTWVPFHTFNLDVNSALVTRHNASNARGFDRIRAEVTDYSGTAQTVTVTVNWRDPEPFGKERA